MIGIGAAYLVLSMQTDPRPGCMALALIMTGIVGLQTNNSRLVDLAFDILSLEALFMVPRVFSILSLSPYWGVSLAASPATPGSSS